MIEGVVIEWIDSAGVDGWCPLDEVPRAASRCVTVAILLDETDDAFVVASTATLCERDKVGTLGGQAIPKAVAEIVDRFPLGYEIEGVRSPRADHTQDEPQTGTGRRG